jgi:uncharacterized protein YfaS (alpha-2-macroglobulin family)
MRDWLKPGGIVGVAAAFLGALALTVFGVTDEVPMADVTGVAQFIEDGKPIPGAEVHLSAFTDGSDLDGLVTMRTVADESGRFRFRNVPASYATVRAYAPGYSVETGYEVAKDKPDLVLKLAWRGDELQLATNQAVFTPQENPTLVMDGITRRKDIAVSLFKFTDEQIFGTRETYALTRMIAYNRQWGEQRPKNEPKPVQTYTHAIRTYDKEGRFAEKLELPMLAEGIYIVRAEVDGVVRHQWLNVSRLGLITKVSPRSLTAYVVDIETGVPVQGAAIAAIGPQGRRELGTTNAEGLARSNVAGESGAYVMLATHGASRAFAMYDRWSDSDGRSTAAHIQTDRPVYRPGDTVHYKAFVRVPDASGYRLPTVRTAHVTVLDPEGTEMSTEEKPISAHGGVEGSFDVLPEITGAYQLQIEIDGQVHNEYVEVLAYRKPEFKITVTPLEQHYIVGQDAKFKVKAEFFTGEPVVGANLSASAYSAEIWRWSAFDDEEYAWWAYGEDYGYDGEYVGEYEAQTNEEGEAVITVPTKTPEVRDWRDARDARDQRLTLSVNGEDASGRVFSGSGEVDVVRGDIDLSVAFESYVVAPNDPVRVRVRALKYGTNEPVAEKKVNLTYGTESWDGRRSKRTKRGSTLVTLDAKGEGTVQLQTSADGDFYVEASVMDSGGHTVRAIDTVWVYEPDSYSGRPATNLQVVLDKKQYVVGEMATALVTTDDPSGSAIVTLEADDVLWTKIVKLDQQATPVEIPVTDSVRPNASLQVCYIRKKAYSQSGRGLIVDMGRDRLNILVEANKKEALPGDTLSYKVTATDSQGRPVVADVCLGVVDEGVYSIAEDNTDPLESFFPNRWSSVGTFYSFPEVYLDGDDKSAATADVRTDFRDTAFWVPSVVTGADGTATLSVKLPDNLTSWRATAVVVTNDARAGKGRGDVIARKPLMVRASPPAFMVQDDRQTIGATVRNETDQDQTVDVRLTAVGLKVEGQDLKKIELKARSSARAEWDVVASSVGEARIRVSAVASRSGNNDALEVRFPVHVNGPTYESYAAGDTTSSAVFEMDLRPNAVAADLELSVSPSILGSVVDSLDDLVDYPYGCVEQTMSRFMPAVVVRQFLRESGIENPALDARIVEVAEKSQARLRSMQRSDGGFGWWGYDSADPEMTALVLEGLHQAGQAGVDVNAQMLAQALDWSRQFAKSGVLTEGNVAARVRLAYALSLHKVPHAEWSRLLVDPKQLGDDVTALAYMVLAVRRSSTDDQRLTDFSDRAYRRLIVLATETGSTMAWPGEYWNEPSAIATLAVLAVEPESARPAKAIRYLVGQKRGSSWTSTRETAQVVLAAVSYLRSQKELQSNSEVRLIVNGREIAMHKFGAQDLIKTSKSRIDASSLKPGKNEIVVQITGSGRAYYSAMLTQSVADPDPKPADSGHGLKIKREYFRMETRRLEDGTLRLVPSKNPVTRVQSGDVLHCRITIETDRDREYVMVEDPALSNSRAIDSGDPNEWEWYYWWSAQTFLDDRTAIFVRYLNKGENTVEYTFRAEAGGTSAALPATVSLMYQPDVRATTGTTRFEVRR